MPERGSAMTDRPPEGEAPAAGEFSMAGRRVGRPFVKMHGLRNHFVIFDNRVDHGSFSVEDIVRICDTQVGVGGDQLLTIEKPSRAGVAAGASAGMRIFNIDGREVSACGNATRCVAHLLLEESGLPELVLETGGGMLKCRRAGTMQVSVEMAAMSTDWRRFPVSREIDMLHVPAGNGPLRDGLAVWIGNPHVVHFVERLSDVDMPAVAPAIQNDPLFPEGVNVGAAEMVDGETIRLAVWEQPGNPDRGLRHRGLRRGLCGTAARTVAEQPLHGASARRRVDHRSARCRRYRWSGRPGGRHARGYDRAGRLLLPRNGRRRSAIGAPVRRCRSDGAGQATRRPSPSSKTHPSGAKPSSTCSPSRRIAPCNSVLARTVVPLPMSIS